MAASILTAGASNHRQLSQVATIGGGMLIATATGVAIGWSPNFAFLPLGVFAGVLLVKDARCRVAFVVLGGLATLQSSNELDLSKVGYLAGAVVIFAVAFLNCRRIKADSKWQQVCRPLWCSSFLFLLLIGISFFVSSAYGTSVSAWFRDIVPYLLFASMPIFALDAQLSASRSSLLPIFVSAGTLTAVSWAVEFLNRRNFIGIPLERFTLLSLLLPAALFSYAVAEGLQGRNHRAAWFALSILVLSLLLLSATRSGFLLLLAPLAMVFVVKGDIIRRILKLGLFSGVAVLGVFIFISYLAHFARVDTGMIIDRLQSAIRVLGNPWSDASFIERASQTEAAWQLFASNMLFGAGPGYSYDWWSPSFRKSQVTFAAVDSPLLFPAKFGLIGIVLLAATILLFILFIRRLIRCVGPTVPCVGLVGYMAVVGAQLLYVSPFHDKGMSFGLLFLLALSLRADKKRLQNSTDQVAYK